MEQLLAQILNFFMFGWEKRCYQIADNKFWKLYSKTNFSRQRICQLSRPRQTLLGTFCATLTFSILSSSALRFQQATIKIFKQFLSNFVRFEGKETWLGEELYSLLWVWVAPKVMIFLVVLWSKKRSGLFQFRCEIAWLCFYTLAWNWVCCLYVEQLSH